MAAAFAKRTAEFGYCDSNLISKIVKFYFGSWWLPALVYACVAMLWLRRLRGLPWDDTTTAILFYAAGAGYLGMIAASLWNLIKKRWRVGILNVLLCVVCGAVTLQRLSTILVGAPVVDNLTIPDAGSDDAAAC